MRPHSKTLLEPIVLLTIFSIILAGMLAAKDSGKSPHGFNPPQCTWWADRRCAESGWTLQFRQDHGRDAWLWPGLLLNGTEITRPEVGCLAVFLPWPGAAVGHVAFVESVEGEQFTISHANYGIGNECANESKVVIRRAKMRTMESGCAQFDGHDAKFKMIYIKRQIRN